MNIDDNTRDVIIASDHLGSLIVKTEFLQLDELEMLDKDINRWIDPDDGYAFDLIHAFRIYIGRLIAERKEELPCSHKA